MAVKSKSVLPFLVPKLTTPPVNTKALAILSSVAGEALIKHLEKILPAMIQAVNVGADGGESVRFSLYSYWAARSKLTFHFPLCVVRSFVHLSHGVLHPFKSFHKSINESFFFMLLMEYRLALGLGLDLCRQKKKK